MTKPRDTAPAFARIAEQLEYLLPQLESKDPAEVMSSTLAITQTLASVGLTWSDLTARVVAPPPPTPADAAGITWRAPPMYPPTVPRAVDPGITADNVISQAGPGHGYRGGYGKVEPAW